MAAVAVSTRFAAVLLVPQKFHFSNISISFFIFIF